MKARPKNGVMYRFGTLYQCYIYCHPQQKWDYVYKGDKVELRYKNMVITITTDDFKGHWLEVNQMEDRYLFKAKRIDNGEWIQGYLYGIWEKRYILWGMTNDIPNMIEVDPSTICQCAGMKDKNGKPVFDNDIVNAISFNTVGKPIRVDDIVVNMSDYNLMLGLNSVNVLEYVGNIFDKKGKEDDD